MCSLEILLEYMIKSSKTENPKYYSQGRDSGLFDELK